MDNIRIHVLGYCFDPANERLNERLSALQGQRRERMFAILDRLKALGAPLDASDVLNRAGNGSVGRPHVAQALADAGYVTSYREAFRRYLHDEGPAYVPKPPFTAREGIALLHAAAAIAAERVGPAARDPLARRPRSALAQRRDHSQRWTPEVGQGLGVRQDDAVQQPARGVDRLPDRRPGVSTGIRLHVQ